VQTDPLLGKHLLRPPTVKRDHPNVFTPCQLVTVSAPAISGRNVRRGRQSRRTDVPHPHPLPTTGEGIKINARKLGSEAREPDKVESPSSHSQFDQGGARILVFNHPGSAKPRVGFLIVFRPFSPRSSTPLCAFRGGGFLLWFWYGPSIYF
jgi:hypothetical protein